MSSEEEWVEVFGARVHNLQNVDVSFPRNKLVVITGLSGSGKSSLAFDTIYAEGQRRYMETFSAYARQFLGNLERPDVDKIKGLSPVISIEQKTTNTNPRSTVGTVTEIYDFMRLLYARASDAYSYATGELMIRMTEEQIQEVVMKQFTNKNVLFLAPVVKGRKGHYRELFQQIATMGFVRVRIDGEITEIKRGLQADRYKTHDIEIIIDRLYIEESSFQRITDSIKTTMKHGKGTMILLDEKDNRVRHLSQHLMCPTSGISYDEPAPNSFSFNSPYGACSTCNGLGEVTEADIQKIIPDTSKSIKQGGLIPLGDYKKTWIFDKLDSLLNNNGYSITTPISEIDTELLNTILYGNEDMEIVNNNNYIVRFEGIINFIFNE
jgi:excinuclease ABC subunit A